MWLLQSGLLLLSVGFSACVHAVRTVDPLHALSLLFVTSAVQASAAAAHVVLLGPGFRKTFERADTAAIVRIVVIDVFTDFLNTLPLLLPSMTFALHSVLQRSQTFFALASSRAFGKPVSSREAFSALLSTAACLIFVVEDSPRNSDATSSALYLIAILSVIASKISLEVSQMVEMQAVQSGVSTAGMLLITNALGAPLAALLMWTTYGLTPLQISPQVVPLLLLASGVQTAYMSLKMRAHKRNLSTLTHAHLSNVRSVLNVCIGKGLPYQWTTLVWFAVGLTACATLIKARRSKVH